MLYYTSSGDEEKRRGDFSFFKLRRHDTNVWGRNLPIFWPIWRHFYNFSLKSNWKDFGPPKGVKIDFLLGPPTLAIYVALFQGDPPWENLMIWRDLKKYPLIFLIFLRPETAPGLLILLKIDNLDLSYTREVKSHPFLIQLLLINLLNWIKNMCWSLS